MSQKTVSVSSMSCGHCVNTIEREVGELEGVASVAADLDRKEVTVEWDDGALDWEAIRTVMHEINYPPDE